MNEKKCVFFIECMYIYKRAKATAATARGSETVTETAAFMFLLLSGFPKFVGSGSGMQLTVSV